MPNKLHITKGLWDTFNKHYMYTYDTSPAQTVAIGCCDEPFNSYCIMGDQTMFNSTEFNTTLKVFAKLVERLKTICRDLPNIEILFYKCKVFFL